MTRLDKVYLSQSEVDELAEEFYRSYDKDHWNLKIEMYDYLLENMENVFEGRDEEFVEYCRRQVRAEFVYMFYHSFEALLGLIRSLTENGIPWIDLKETYTGDIENFVKNDMKEDDFNRDLCRVFYPGLDASDPGERVEDAVESIWEYLDRAGRIYCNRTVYNEYKHGLRLITKESDVEMDIQGGVPDGRDVDVYDDVERREDGLMWTGLTGDILLYLDASVWKREDGNGKKYWSLSRSLQPLEFEFYRRLCGFNADLIDQIFSVRRGSVSGDLEVYENWLFWNDIDMSDVLRPRSPIQELVWFSYHPRSEDDVLEYEIQ